MSKMAEVRLTLEEYEAMRRLITSERESEGAVEEARVAPKKKRRSKYRRLYDRNFQTAKVKFMSKTGKWRKDGFRKAVKLAHKMTRGNL
jgi:hypothetical protein